VVALTSGYVLRTVFSTHGQQGPMMAADFVVGVSRWSPWMALVRC